LPNSRRSSIVGRRAFKAERLRGRGGQAATALIAAGAFAPMAAWLYGLSRAPGGVNYFAALALTCVLAGAGLHVLALAVLRRLRQ